MMSLPSHVVAALESPAYLRDGHAPPRFQFLLGVEVPVSFRDFYTRFAGPFWSDSLGIELSDIVDDSPNIVSLTRVAREVHSFPERFLVLTELSAGDTIHVLDANTDSVFVVDFEGGSDELLNGTLVPRWTSFDAFLSDYFQSFPTLDGAAEGSKT